MVTNSLKIIATSLALLCSLILSVQAKANDKIAPYIGAGYQFNYLHLKRENINSFHISYYDYYEDHFKNLGLFMGFNLKDTNFNFEIAYSNSGWESKSNNNTSIAFGSDPKIKYVNDSRLKKITLDAIYNHKMPNYDKFSFLAIAGLSKISFDTIHKEYLQESDSLDTSSYVYQDGYGLNFGFGIEADIVNNLSVRTIFKQSTVNNIGEFDSLTSLNVAFKYQY